MPRRSPTSRGHSQPSTCWSTKAPCSSSWRLHRRQRLPCTHSPRRQSPICGGPWCAWVTDQPLCRGVANVVPAFMAAAAREASKTQCLTFLGRTHLGSWFALAKGRFRSADALHFASILVSRAAQQHSELSTQVWDGRGGVTVPFFDETCFWEAGSLDKKNCHEIRCTSKAMLNIALSACRLGVPCRVFANSGGSHPLSHVAHELS